MTQRFILLIFLIFTFSCKEKIEPEKELPVLWQPYNDSLELVANADHEKERMRYKFIQSKVTDKNAVFLPLYDEVSKFSEEKYKTMKPLVLEQDIPTIQNHINDGKFSYEDLALFFLHRIYTYELPNETTLNTVIALNPNVLEEARKLDANAVGKHPIYGMPIMLKDNIGVANMKTTAGAIALMHNQTDDAFIVERLKKNGALILGKVNLSEWANFLCECPNGQSAVGGQTLNPYGRRVFDTGGSSAGSGTSVAANYAVAAVGTETSGSILSPSGQNSVVGLKPTIGLLSRTGIVPISSTLDTPGPMTKNVGDNAIVMSAMLGHDDRDSKSVEEEFPGILSAWMHPTPFKEMRLGALTTLMENDSLYARTIGELANQGAEIVEITPKNIEMDGFLSILNIDMKNDLPKYIEAQVKNKDCVLVRNVQDVAAFNLRDSLIRIPYGQARFDGILSDSTTVEELDAIKQRLKLEGRTFFDTPMDEHNLDALLSINNYHAGYAAVAEYPALTIPMGYKDTGEPVNLTFIGKPFTEAQLLRLGATFEKAFRARRIPDGYR
ncbi:amidase family protein [Maribacter algicola]|uniref:Amidase family protein n=1 Tax=Meishania litoralis TaxID=3434685 RepID=A0ACC7LNT6_9FLAO